MCVCVCVCVAMEYGVKLLLGTLSHVPSLAELGTLQSKEVDHTKRYLLGGTRVPGRNSESSLSVGRLAGSLVLAFGMDQVRFRAASYHQRVLP